MLRQQHREIMLFFVVYYFGTVVFDSILERRWPNFERDSNQPRQDRAIQSISVKTISKSRKV